MEESVVELVWFTSLKLLACLLDTGYWILDTGRDKIECKADRNLRFGEIRVLDWIRFGIPLNLVLPLFVMVTRSRIASGL